MNPRTFTVVTSTTDSLTADRLVAVLTEAGLDAFSRAGGAASANPLSPAEGAFFDVLVATESLEQAGPLVKKELEDIERDSEENAKAAEEEALSGENPTA